VFTARFSICVLAPLWNPHDPRKFENLQNEQFSTNVELRYASATAHCVLPIDAKIRIWATSPILSPKAEERGQPKALCTLNMHTGPVLAVRWASSGKWLASGSDDTIVMIWDLDP
jgi:WD40 repeat protein